MYLSQLILNPRSRQVQAELREPYQMHRTLSKAFGDQPGEWEAARVLFRVDGYQDKPAVLIQSKSQPDWTSLTASDGYLAAEPQVKPFNPSFKVGQQLAFRLLANPTVKREGKRLGLYKEQKQVAWLKRKAHASGFCALSAVPTDMGKVKGRTTNGHDTTLLAIRFDGELQVTDVERFIVALQSGVGSAKAFGFGLLSVARLR